MRRRISLATEERIWFLRCQGWLLREIAQCTGCSYSATRYAIRRARRRRLPLNSPLHRQYRYPRADVLPAPKPQPPAAPLRFANRLLHP